jgi:hypothetical protein
MYIVHTQILDSARAVEHFPVVDDGLQAQIPQRHLEHRQVVVNDGDCLLPTETISTEARGQNMR